MSFDRAIPGRKDLQAVGTGYGDDLLSITEVARLLGVAPPDALIMLVSGGYHRPLEVIRLTPEERQARLQAIRIDRLARKGAPAPDEDLIARDVIASERLESVDARRWISLGGH